MIETLNQIIEDGVQKKILHNFTSPNSEIPNSHIIIDNHQMINFGSCSYLGLEKHNKTVAKYKGVVVIFLQLIFSRLNVENLVVFSGF